jgi:quinol-cytochrome oxidoreductase complex cytochrome b subunit
MERIPSWDVFIGLAVVLAVAYGFILKREKTITVLCSTYIAIVMSGSFTEYVFQFFQGNKVIANQIWVRGNMSESTVAIGLFLIVLFFVSGAINSSSSSSGDLSPFEVIVYTTLTVALAVSTILGYLPEETRNNILSSSKVGSVIYGLRTLWVIAPPISLVILNFRRK